MTAISGAPSGPGRKPDRLTRRAEYVAASKGRRFHTALLTVQAAERAQDAAPDAVSPRFGLTVSRRVGNAVVRNRVKRRLREALKRLAGEPQGSPGQAHFDYVIVARREALDAQFHDLVTAVTEGIGGVHRPRRKGAGRAPRSSPPPQTD